MEYKGKKIGAYKDENGKLFIIEPYCAHLGCELSWNGSRYTYEGKVITEPTVKDLKKL